MLRNTRKFFVPSVLASAHAAPLALTAQRFYANNIKHITSKKAPKAVGPYRFVQKKIWSIYAFSQAVKANGTIYVSGCLGIVPEVCNFILQWSTQLDWWFGR